ncbi:MAG: tol-pal system protein YbgF [Betaproteobacteria bacterium]
MRPLRRLSSLLLLTLLWAGTAQAGLFDDAEARRQVADLKATSEARYDTQSKALLDLANQISVLRDENAKLRGQVETLTYELEQTKKRQQDFYVDLDNRLRKFEPQPAAGAGDAGSKPVAGDPAAEGQEYEAALNLFKAAKYKEASAAFSSFVTAHPASSLAPSAQFWLGNAWYAQRDCKRAIEAQNLLLSKWPTSPKAPEAMLAVATCQHELGNSTAAKHTLENIIAQYPEAPAATSAKQRLKKK